jgi:tRNA pseudouridine55 synthase
MITKTQTKKADFDFTEGETILIDKDYGLTSFTVVNRIRRIVGVKKVGHAGTLDPAATGLLIICTGRKTKEIYRFQDLEKTYTGTISLGKTTASMDVETEFISEHPVDGIETEDLDEARKSFLGKTFQLPPMHSALKHKGKALYKYARKGIDVKRFPREINISKFEFGNIELPDVAFEIKCSKGTYVRVIAHDFGEKLKCGAYLKNLRRTAIGDHKVEDAFTLKEFEQKFGSTS